MPEMYEETVAGATRSAGLEAEPVAAARGLLRPA